MADRAPVPPKPEAEGMGEERLREIQQRVWDYAAVGTPAVEWSNYDIAIVAEVRRLRGEVDELTWKVEDLKGDAPLPHCSGLRLWMPSPLSPT